MLLRTTIYLCILYVHTYISTKAQYVLRILLPPKILYLTDRIAKISKTINFILHHPQKYFSFVVVAALRLEHISRCCCFFFFHSTTLLHPNLWQSDWLHNIIMVTESRRWESFEKKNWNLMNIIYPFPCIAGKLFWDRHFSYWGSLADDTTKFQRNTVW